MINRPTVAAIATTCLAAGIAIGASHRTAPVQPAGPLVVSYEVGYVVSANLTAIQVKLLAICSVVEYQESMILRYGQDGEYTVSVPVERASVIAGAIDDAIMAAVQRQELTREVEIPSAPGRMIRVTGSTRGVAIQAIPAPGEAAGKQPEVRLSVENAEVLIQMLRRSVGHMEWIGDRTTDLRLDAKGKLEQQRRLGRPRGRGA